MKASLLLWAFAAFLTFGAAFFLTAIAWLGVLAWRSRRRPAGRLVASRPLKYGHPVRGIGEP